MVTRKLDCDSSVGVYEKCYNTLLDKNIREGLYYKDEEHFCYLIFDKTYLSYANKQIFLKIASVYKNNFFFANDLDNLDLCTPMIGYFKDCKSIVENCLLCSNKNYWFFKVSRDGVWSSNYSIQSVLQYVASFFLRQDPFMLDGNKTLGYVPSYIADDYDRYTSFPEDLEPYELCVRYVDVSENNKQPDFIVANEILSLNQDEDQMTLEASDPSFAGCRYEPSKKVFMLKREYVFRTMEKYNK